MAKPIFKRAADEPSLFPQDIFSKIKDKHPAKIISDIVDNLDLSSIINKYKGGGTSSFHPKMMIKILFYGYLTNVYSCRKIEKALQENIYFMWLAGNLTPDFRTINYFRGKRLKEEIKGLFKQLVENLVDKGLVSLETQFIDGTKIESAANKYTFVWRKNVERNKANLEKKIRNVLDCIENSIQNDNNAIEQNNIQLPEKFNSEDLKEVVDSINKNITKKKNPNEAKEIKKLQDEYLPKLEKYEKDIEILGDRNSYSKTDNEATFFRMKDDHMQNGQLKPAYNIQVSTESQIITNYTLHQVSADTVTFEKHINDFENQYQKQSNIIVADAGYGSEENYEILKQKNITGYVKYNTFQQEQTEKYKLDITKVSNWYYNKVHDYYVCPMGQRMEKIVDTSTLTDNGYKGNSSVYQAKNCLNCPLRVVCNKGEDNKKIHVNHRLNELRNEARELLHSEKGIYYRKKRNIEPESVFGQIKFNNKFNRFTFYGLKNVILEFGLMAIGHNLRKLVHKILNFNVKGFLILIYNKYFNQNLRIERFYIYLTYKN